MRLVEKGKLGLDDAIGPILDDLPESWRGVTVRQLLNHTSGLPDLVVLSGNSVEYLAPTREEAMEKAYALPPPAGAGQQCAYNQTGYVLLGRIIEKRTGKAFRDYMKAEFFGPLGLTETVYANFADSVPGRARLYEVGRYLPVAGALRRVTSDRPAPHESWDNPDFNDVGATLNTSIADLAKWDAALGDGRVLSPQTLKLMWAVAPVSRRSRGGATDGYSCGWVVREGAGRATARHTGGDAAVYDRALDDSLTIAVLTNAMYAGIEDVEARIRAACTPAP
jgi:CubicO group peptidase (beta-lactamase class C family)